MEQLESFSSNRLDRTACYVLNGNNQSQVAGLWETFILNADVLEEVLTAKLILITVN
nr:hypothetical protein [Entomoplasma sp. MP1]